MTKERRFFKGRFEIRLGAVHVPDARVRLAVQANPNMVEETFVTATFYRYVDERTVVPRHPSPTVWERVFQAHASRGSGRTPGLEASDGLASVASMRVG